MNEQEKIKTIKIKVDNEVSSTFCLAKWHHVTMYLQTGETHSCYHPAPHKIPLIEVFDNPSALHNTEHKKQERKMMLEGKKPEGCQYATSKQPKALGTKTLILSILKSILAMNVISNADTAIPNTVQDSLMRLKNTVQ